MIEIDVILDKIINFSNHNNSSLKNIRSLLNLDLDNIKGCSLEEISKIEEFYDIKLPYSYKKFLVKMGHNAGDFLSGTDAFYNNIFNLKNWANELLYECKQPFTLESKYFVFAMHQGYQFWFFSTEGNIDPEIYYYYEGEKIFYKKHQNFSEFLLDNLTYLK